MRLCCPQLQRMRLHVLTTAMAGKTCRRARSPRTPQLRLMYIIYEAANIPLGLKLAEEAKSTGSFDLVLWTPYHLPNHDYVSQCSSDLGFLYVNEVTASGGLANIHGRISSWLTATPRAPADVFCSRKTLTRPQLVDKLDQEFKSQFEQFVDHALRRTSFCDDIIARLNIDAVLMAEDNPERDSAMWIAAARNRNCVSMVVSYGDLDPTETLSAYATSERHRTPNHLVADTYRVMPHWCAEIDGGTITRLPLPQSLAMICIGCDYRNPWIVNTGSADIVGVESQALLERHVSLGADRRRLHLVGHPIKDTMADTVVNRAQLRSTVEERELIIVAIPPDQTGHRGTEFGSYESVQDAFLLPLMQEGTRVIVSLHPNCSEAHRSRLQALGYTVSDEPLAKILPLADLFVASVSSTIKWALSCGIPVLNYDIYDYGYDTYDGSAAVQTVSSLHAYREAISRWRDPAEQRRRKTAATADSARWGPPEGGSMQRIISLIRAYGSL